MKKPSTIHSERKAKVLSRTTLIVILVAVFTFSIFLGITAVAMGLGSIYPKLNSIAQPVACPGKTMSHSQQISEVGTATYYTAKWFCVDETTGERMELSGNTVALISGPVYGVVIFGMLFAILYMYWYSSVGPAKNGGPDLW